MNSQVSKEEREVIGRIDGPAVSIVLPFEPKMSLEVELEYRLKLILAKVEKELMSGYAAELALPVIKKLSQVVRQLNFNTHKKSIAIFVSRSVEKVFYLDLPVEEKVVIDESFEIRDLVYSKKQTIQYLLLLLSGKSSRMYLGNCSKFILIKSNVPDNVNAYERDLPEKVTHFCDAHNNKEVLLDKFLLHMDEGLSLVLKAYPLPVFVLGAKRVLGHFGKITRNEKSIIQTIEGKYEEAGEPELRRLIKPYVADWNKVKQQNLMQQIEAATSSGTLVSGIDDVWNAASRKNARLLIVEKNFIIPSRPGANSLGIFKENTEARKPFYIKDAVDDVMEKVLQIGGDVEFVDDGLLKNYGRIALIRYFNDNLLQ